jgi:hypothetical protein
MRVVRSVLLVAVLVVCFGSGFVTAQEGTPVASPVASEAPYDPLALYDALLKATLDQQYWPSGATSANASPWVNSGDPTLQGTVAAVQITFEGNQSTALAFAIYPTAADAQAGLERAATLTAGVATPVATPSNASDPTVVLDYGNFKVCLIQVNNVLVDGVALDAQSAIVIAKAGVEHVRNVASVVPTGSATPEASTQVFGEITPDQLSQRLLVATFAGAGVPANLTNPQVAAWTDESDSDLIGTVSAATVSFTGGDNQIAFLVFPNATAAKQRLIETAAEERANGADFTERDDLDYPAVITVNGTDLLCVLQVDYVLVAANSTIQNGHADAALTEALTLALAGADHLVKLATAT